MSITPKWREALLFYRGLQQAERGKFLHSLTRDQKDYLLNIIDDGDATNHLKKANRTLNSVQDAISTQGHYPPVIISKIAKSSNNISKYEETDSLASYKKYFNQKKEPKETKKFQFNSVTLTLTGLIAGIMTFALVSTVSIYAKGEDPTKSFGYLTSLIDVRSQSQKKTSLEKNFEKYLKENSLLNNNPDEDEDKDGLTNFDEFLLQSNPKDIDSNKNGVSDSIEYLNRKYPSTSKNIADREYNIIKENIKSDFDIFLNLLKNKAPTYSFDNQIKIEGGTLKIDYSKPVFFDFEKFGIKSEDIYLNKDISEFEKAIRKDNLANFPSANILSSGSAVFVFPDPLNSSKESLKKVYLSKSIVEPGSLISFNIKSEDGQNIKAVYKVNYNNIVSLDSDKFFENKNISQVTLVIPLTDENYSSAEIIRASLVSVETF